MSAGVSTTRGRARRGFSLWWSSVGLPRVGALARFGRAASRPRRSLRFPLTAACGLCHNERLDQRLSRARFHTDLDRLSREAREAAVRRLDLAPEDLAAMPPRRVFALSETARLRLMTLLRP